MLVVVIWLEFCMSYVHDTIKVGRYDREKLANFSKPIFHVTSAIFISQFFVCTLPRNWRFLRWQSVGNHCFVLMYEKDEEKSKNVGVNIDILELVEIHCHRKNSVMHSIFWHVYIFTYACNPLMENVQIIILIDKTQFGSPGSHRNWLTLYILISLIFTASFHSLEVSNRRHRPITVHNFHRYVVVFSNTFENIFCWPTFVGREKFNGQFFTNTAAGRKLPCSSMCIIPESMTSSSCDSVLSLCGVVWNIMLWMMSLISGNVVWEPVDILTIT